MGFPNRKRKLIMDEWLKEGLKKIKSTDYLKKRGVDENCKVSFFIWEPHKNIPCKRFKSSFGLQGEKLVGQLIIPIYSPTNQIIGLECRRLRKDGSKQVHQYRTIHAQWNPYLLGSKEAFDSLWEGNDLWIVEGIFDKVALDKVLPSCDAVASTLRAGMDSNTLDMIERFYSSLSTVYICYDNDETGRKKSYWLTKEMSKRGIRAIQWKYRGKDPGEVFSLGGEKALRRMFL